MEPALALARQIVEVAERQDDTTYRLVGYRLLGMMQVYMGRNREALESLQHAERYRDPVRQKLLSYRFGTDPGLAAFATRYGRWRSSASSTRRRESSEQVRAELPKPRTCPHCRIV